VGPEHHDTLLAMTNLASIFRSEGKYAQAETPSRCSIVD